MDPLHRLSIFMTRLVGRRWSRIQSAIALGALALAVLAGVIEWAGYWPEEWTVARRRWLPRVG